VKGGTGYVLEYFGEGAGNYILTGKGTICNMGAEIGPLPPSSVRLKMEEYLRGTGRAEIADLAALNKSDLPVTGSICQAREIF